jgi:hypothetical protein
MAFGNRVVPPVGDHGLSRSGPDKRLGKLIGPFNASTNPQIKRIAAQMAYLVEEDGGRGPEGIEPARPDMSSKWLQGYGTTMRARGTDPTAWQLTLKGALIVPTSREEDPAKARRDLHLTVPIVRGKPGTQVSGKQPTFNQGRTAGTLAVIRPTQWQLDLDVGGDKWVKGGPARLVVDISQRDPGASYSGQFNGQRVAGSVDVEPTVGESFVVLRAGQSWGHHHMDKGSLWCWFDNVHFFGDCGWGGPPGGTYWNPFKQGPQSGTQIEFVGVNNWTLPCKYPAPWIADDEYADAYDYAMARCDYPFNPDLDIRPDAPVAVGNHYDRQVLFVHGDVLIVRDNVETMCPTVWRMHTYQPTSVKGNTATLASPQKVIGQLTIAHPRGAKLTASDKFPQIHPYTGETSNYAGQPFGSTMLKWQMPANTSATWVFAAHDEKAKRPPVEALDDTGRVTRITTDGTQIIALMNGEPFTFAGHGIRFDGTVGLVIRRGGKVEAYPIRARKLTAR